MPGVGHTIDFPNRNQILTTAYLWLDSVRTTQISNVSIEENALSFNVYPTVLKADENYVHLNVTSSELGGNVYVLNALGEIVTVQNIEQLESDIALPNENGIYLIYLESDKGSAVKRVLKL